MQGNITTVGTIGTGTWQGTVVGATYGGTGINNGSNTITLAGNVVTAGTFTTSGAFAMTLTATASSNSTLPAGTDTLAGLGTAQTFTNQNLFNVARTIASAAGATLGDLGVSAATTTITGTTTIATAAGFNKVFIGTPTFTDASGVIVTTAASLYVANAPQAAGSVTITNPWAINVGAGNVNFPGTGNQLGTITSGTWNGAAIDTAYGGTGAANLNAFLLAGTTNTITIGYAFTPNNIGTVSSGTTTPSCSAGNYQYLTDNGAFTLAAPSSDCGIDLLVTNGASAGTISFSGFTVGSSTGSSLTTTNGNKFVISIRRIDAIATYSIYALQ